MFPNRFFGGRMFAPRYFPKTGGETSYGTTLILTDRTSTGDGVSRGVIQDATFGTVARESSGGGIA